MSDKDKKNKDKDIEEEKPKKGFFGGNTIEVKFEHPISIGGSACAGKVVNQYLAKGMTGDLTVNVSAVKPVLLKGSKSRFETDITRHLKGKVKFVYA